MLSFAPRFIAVFLCATALAGCASTASQVATLTGGDTAAGHAQKVAAAGAPDKATPTDLDGGIRQAQLLRQAGQYDDAIKILSQLMLVASDDPRVVSEYGKNLAQIGRAQDATEFLNRAIELSSNDWTLYSALGVSYDQLGNQVSARAAYEHALALRPNEPSVLNNYALSRMLANDPQGAHLLIAKAEAVGGASDSKIAANIALLNKLAPAPKTPETAAAEKPAPAKPADMASAMPHPAAPAAQSAPRTLTPAPVVENIPPAPAMTASGVVMQKVPVDPHAGPVALKKPRPKPVAAAKPDNKPDEANSAKPAAANTADAKGAPAKPDPKAKPAAASAAKDQVPALRLTADARNP